MRIMRWISFLSFVFSRIVPTFLLFQIFNMSRTVAKKSRDAACFSSHSFGWYLRYEVDHPFIAGDTPTFLGGSNLLLTTDVLQV